MKSSAMVRALVALALTFTAIPALAKDVPPWASGVFEGRNAKYKAHIRARIDRDGDVKWDVDNKDKRFTLQGQIRRGTLSIQGKRYDVVRRGDGLSIRHVGESDDVTELHRVSGDRDERDGPRMDPDRRPGGPDRRPGGPDRRPGKLQPPWYMGTFSGRNRRDGLVRLEISGPGVASLTTTNRDGKQVLATGIYKDDVLRIDGKTYEIRRGGGDGILFRRTDSKGASILLHRE